MRQAAGLVLKLAPESVIMLEHPYDDIDIVAHGFVHVLTDGASCYSFIDQICRGIELGFVIFSFEESG